MKRNFSTTSATTALTLGAIVGLPASGISQTAPPIGGGYTNAIAIPVDDPATKNIAGALFKPAGASPFPAVVYMSGCAGLNIPPETLLEKTVIDHPLAKGVATLIVDPFTPRNEFEGICATLDEKKWAEYATRGGGDAVAAVKVLRSMPDIDPDRIFLQGYSYGARASLYAADMTARAQEVKIAGVIAYYPYCYDNVEFSTPTLVLIGDKDDWTPASLCEAVREKPNVEIVVFPGATHAFNMPFKKPVDYLGHHFVHDEKATQEALKDADAFMDSHLK
jgi:dienelactone hydrolase